MYCYSMPKSSLSLFTKFSGLNGYATLNSLQLTPRKGCLARGDFQRDFRSFIIIFS